MSAVWLMLALWCQSVLQEVRLHPAAAALVVHHPPALHGTPECSGRIFWGLDAGIPTNMYAALHNTPLFRSKNNIMEYFNILELLISL